MTATIFVSSTPFDLALHRKKIIDSCGQPGSARPDVTVVATLPETSVENRLHLVRAAKAYIGIFGMMFGDVDPVTKKSLVQLELEEALAQKIPMLIYIIDEDEHWVLPKHVDTGESAQHLSQLKGLLSQFQDVRFFDSADDLVAKVHNDLFRVLGAVGSIPAASAKSAPVAPVTVATKPVSEKKKAEPAAPAAKTAASEPVAVKTATPASAAGTPVATPAGGAPLAPVAATSAPVKPAQAAPAPAVPASSLASKRYVLSQPKFEFFKEKVKHLFGPYMSDTVLKDVLEYVLAGNTMSASSTLARGTSLSLEDSIEEIRKTELIILDTVQRHAAQNNDHK
ncbi:DUF4062 domain-containing protein [Undibacterium jejuense]|uniref:DUF4062 domain-containing protein n=1 Tax=Undibacterium jejuense TaxID=1344949 RepID=A0A923HPI4_9BURK|nr:DUF4062 domain-containing protein [Undibacterium jejuense]MBC3862373.1 DUF4062 domain-containing protein [Undibacterium jejuense]